MCLIPSGFIGSYGRPLGILPRIFEPGYSKDEHVSDSEDSDLEGNPVSKQVENTDWCRCKVCVSRSERKCTCCNEWDILEERLEAEDVDCVTQHMDLDVYLLGSFSTSNLLSKVFDVEPSYSQYVVSFLNN